MFPEYIPMRVQDLQELIKTIEETTRILAIRENAEAYVRRGIAKCKAGLYEDGSQDITKALQMSPFYAMTQMTLATGQEYARLLESGQKFLHGWQVWCDSLKT